MPRTRRITLALVLVASLVAVVAACGGSSSKAQSSTQSSSATTSTTVVESVSSSSAADNALPLPEETPLQGGVRYKVHDARVPIDVSFEAVDGGFGWAPGAAFSHSLDEVGVETLLTSFYLEQARNFTEPDPAVDERTNFLAATAEAGDDYLAYIAAIPAFTVGPVQDATVDGRPARSMQFEMTAPGGNTTTCGTPGMTCVAVTYFSSGGVIIFIPGEGGTLYQFDVEGHPVVVYVNERPQAADVLASLHYTKRA